MALGIIIVSMAMKTLDDSVRHMVRRSARHQDAIQDGCEIHFPLCWQLKTAVAFILVGCASLLALISGGGPASPDPWYVLLIPVSMLTLLPLAILFLLPGRVVIDPKGIRQRFWWRREKYIPWKDFASAVRDRNDGSTIVYGKFQSPIAFSPYLVDQLRFDREVKAWSRTNEIPEDN